MRKDKGHERRCDMKSVFLVALLIIASIAVFPNVSADHSLTHSVPCLTTRDCVEIDRPCQSMTECFRPEVPSVSQDTIKSSRSKSALFTRLVWDGQTCYRQNLRTPHGKIMDSERFGALVFDKETRKVFTSTEGLNCDRNLIVPKTVTLDLRWYNPLWRG